MKLRLVSLIFSACAVFAQAPPPAFEVASVKKAQPGRGGLEVTPGNLSMRAVPLARALMWAYDVGDYQFSAPEWMQGEPYDIVAKAATPAPEKELRLMLQTLLAERFKVELHRQTKEMPGFALVIGKSGHKLKESKPEEASELKMTKNGLVAKGVTPAEFANLLRTPIRAHVVDQTGLPGRYDFSLDVTAYLAAVREEHKEGDVPDNSPIAARAVQEQLGLRLEPRKLPVEVLVIDRAERVPVEN